MKFVIKVAVWIVAKLYFITGLEWLVEEIMFKVRAYRIRLNIVPVTFKWFVWILGLTTGISGSLVYFQAPEILHELTKASEPMVFIQKAHADFEEEVKEVEKPIEITDCYTASKVMSKKYGTPEDLMNRIIDSESGNKPKVENGVSTATGCFQWVVGSWRYYGKKLWGDEFFEKNVYNPKDNVELASWVISKYGTGDWDASKHSWAK